MKINKYIYKAIKSISPFKTAVLAVVVSITASFGVSAVSETGKFFISKEMDSLGLNGMSAISYNSYGENSTDIRFYNDIKEIFNNEYVTPVLYENSTVMFSNGTEMNAMSWGISDDAEKIVSINLIEGRMINTTDIENNAFVCLVDENIADTVYKRTNICGKKINITLNGKTYAFTVIGTIKKGSNILNSMTGDMIPDFIYMPYTTMKNLSSKSNFDQIMLTSYHNKLNQDQLKQQLSDKNTLYAGQNIKLTDLSQQKQQITKIADIAFKCLFLVSCVAIIVCSMAVASSVNTAVVTRKKDIGIKMSMGAGTVDITMEFLTAAVSSAMIGIIISFIIIASLLKITEYLTDANIFLDYSLIALSIFVTIILTTIFSLLPSYKAAKMPPIKALNRE